jgi:hypothetical protein
MNMGSVTRVLRVEPIELPLPEVLPLPESWVATQEAQTLETARP